ncbi:MAG: hypothetical protein ACKOE6_15880 [Flammeovirgaceae bacterium]
MKKGLKVDVYIARVTAIALLVITGVSALGGGAMLVLDPTGALLGFGPLDLAGTFFPDFRVPGLILLLLIGVFNLLVAGLAVNKANSYPTLILLQGGILTGWILAQVYLLPVTHFLQLVFGSIGLMLMLLGSLLGSRRAL